VGPALGYRLIGGAAAGEVHLTRAEPLAPRHVILGTRARIRDPLRVPHAFFVGHPDDPGAQLVVAIAIEVAMHVREGHPGLHGNPLQRLQETDY